MGDLKLFGRRGWGSVLTEAQLAWYGLSYEFAEVGDLFTDQGAREALEVYNPLAQVPTLVLPDGQIMTESAAITLLLAEEAGSRDLVPAPGEPERARFLRWLIFITSNIYPTYTYADDPARFVPDASAQAGFAETVTDYAKRLYGVLNGEVTGPWFLGTRFSAMDIYVCTLTHWRPGQGWFREHAPALSSIAKATKALPELTEVWAANYPES